MKEINEDKLESDIEEISVDDNINEIVEDPVSEPDYVTREINLDDLYDGAVNNTVVIDPITNNEILLENKKTNYKILGVVIAIIILLVLYYINNKSDLGRTTTDVVPKTTTESKLKDVYENDSGTLTCTYTSKSDVETQNVTYVASYENSKIIESNFNYVVVNTTDVDSAVVEDLKNQYENFFINNAALTGNNVSYEKNDKGFTFNVKTNYEKSDFDSLIITENQTILFVKPQADDTIDILQNNYSSKGFNCSLTNNKSN